MKQSLRIFAFSLLVLCSISSFIPTTIIINNLERITQDQYFLSDGEGWLDGWTYRQRYNVSNVTMASTGYQISINMTYDSKMQTDFDDLRITDNDGTTLLPSWMEYKVDSDSIKFWTKISDDLVNPTSIYVYYGNSTVSNYWDGDSTFIWYDHFDDGSVNWSEWHEIQGSGLLTEVAAETGYMIQSDGATHSQIGTLMEWSTGIAFHTKTYHDDARIMGLFEFDGSYNPVWDGDCAYYIINLDEVSNENEGVATTTGSITQDWGWYIEAIYWPSSSFVSFYMATAPSTNLVLQATHTTNVPVNDDMGIYGYINNGDAAPSMWYDWMFIRKCANTEPIVSLVGLWETVGSAYLYLSVYDPIILWGIDGIFILAGLIMLPTSTMYLVKGGRSEMSTKKVYIFLILFFVGLGLLIGGIGP